MQRFTGAARHPNPSAGGSNASLFSFPWELWLSRLTEHLIQRRSLVTGQALPTLEPAQESANA